MNPQQPNFKRLTPLDIENLLEKCSGYHCDMVRCLTKEINTIIEDALGLPHKKPSTIVIVGTTASDDCKE